MTRHLATVEMGMQAAPPSIRLSILDRSPVPHGSDHAQALRDTVTFAQQAESLGYHRFWVSEHHSVPGIAGSAPTILAAAIAAATRHIRVGTGGIMLPNHRPLVVAEQFGVLESLFSGRIDLGIGRSVGFTSGIRQALGTDKDAVDQFADQLSELLGYFDGTQTHHPGVRARPGEGLAIPAFILAVGSGAAQAAAFGLPLVIAPVGSRRKLRERIQRYRHDFTPSNQRREPYVMVAMPIAVSDTAESARSLLLPESWSTVLSRTLGEFPPLWSAENVLAASPTQRQQQLLTQSLDGAIHGTPEHVAEQLAQLVGDTTADEILVTTASYDRTALLGSYRSLAGLVAPVAAA